MLNEGIVTPAIAVRDLDNAKEFYSNTLGLGEAEENPAGLLFQSGGSKFLVYQSEFAGTNKATYAGWSVDDVGGTVADLKSRGVQFDTFDMEGVNWEGEVAVMGPAKSAWFKDPDGNILAISNM